MTLAFDGDYRRLIAPQPSDDDCFVMPFSPALEGRTGFVHGGAIIGFMEYAASEIAKGVVGPAQLVRPISMTAQFHRGATDCRTFVRCRISLRTKRLIFVEVSAWQQDESQTVAGAAWKFMITG